MTSILDGPAAGQKFMLTRTPIFLRVTEKDGKFDALNHTYDTAMPGEKLHAYLLIDHNGHTFSAAGCCPRCVYAYIDAQPEQSVLQDNQQWGMWVELASKLNENLDRSSVLKSQPSQQ